MTANPIELVGGLANTGNVVKADLIAWGKVRVPQVMASVSEIRSTTLAGQVAVTLAVSGAPYYLDTADTTTADDGLSCIISADGKRFKILPFMATLAGSQTLTNKTIDTATNTFKLNGVSVATAAQFTAALTAVVGDGGAGGTKGLVPAPAAGDAAAGKYLSAAGVFSVPLPVATQAQMEAATSNAVASTPSTVKYHPAHPKAVAYVTQSAGAYTLQAGASFGIASISKSATGVVDITLTTAFSAVNSMAVSVTNNSGGLLATELIGSRTTTNIRVDTRNPSTTANADGGFTVVVWGDLP